MHAGDPGALTPGVLYAATTPVQPSVALGSIQTDRVTTTLKCGLPEGSSHSPSVEVTAPAAMPNPHAVGSAWKDVAVTGGGSSTSLDAGH